MGRFGGGGGGEGHFAGNENTFQSRNKPGNIARISRRGQVHYVMGKIEDGGRRARESKTVREREIKRR